jgi:hypothetical protein
LDGITRRRTYGLPFQDEKVMVLPIVPEAPNDSSPASILVMIFRPDLWVGFVRFLFYPRVNLVGSEICGG